MKRVVYACLLSVLLVHLTLFGTKKEKPPEYHAKGVFIGRVSSFIQWPEGLGVNDKSRPFIIGIIGENPFFVKEKGEDAPQNWLEEIYVQQKNKIKGKPVEVRLISDIDEIRGCNLLFISKSEKKMVPEIVAAARESHVLTFSDTDGFAKKGVHINLILKSGKLKYEINQAAVEESGLKVKFQLLKYAVKILDPIKRRK